MPVRELVWGRVHSEELDLAYSIAIESGTRKESAKIYLIHKALVLNLTLSTGSFMIKKNGRITPRHTLRIM
jgi:hypothetical protein